MKLRGRMDLSTNKEKVPMSERTSNQNVFFFGPEGSEGDFTQKGILGGKGAGLAEMTSLGIPVPPGFTISTGVCGTFNAEGKKLPENIWQDILKNISRLEKSIGKKFGDQKNPLLVSVRSGARVSMPGMMDTILNLGLNVETTEGLA